MVIFDYNEGNLHNHGLGADEKRIAMSDKGNPICGIPNGTRECLHSWRPTKVQQQKMRPPRSSTMTSSDLSHLTDKAIGTLFREKLARRLEKDWGTLDLEGPWLRTPGKSKILVRYSNRARNRDSWFYDVKQKDWAKWDKTHHHLAFLMRQGPDCSYLLLSPEESAYLLNGLKTAADMSKKIDIRISAKGKLYIQTSR